MYMPYMQTYIACKTRAVASRSARVFQKKKLGKSLTFTIITLRLINWISTKRLLKGKCDASGLNNEQTHRFKFYLWGGGGIDQRDSPYIFSEVSYICILRNFWPLPPPRHVKWMDGWMEPFCLGWTFSEGLIFFSKIGQFFCTNDFSLGKWPFPPFKKKLMVHGFWYIIEVFLNCSTNCFCKNQPYACFYKWMTSYWMFWIEEVANFDATGKNLKNLNSNGPSKKSLVFSLSLYVIRGAVRFHLTLLQDWDQST